MCGKTRLECWGGTCCRNDGGEKTCRKESRSDRE